MPFDEGLTGKSFAGFFQREAHCDFQVIVLYHNPKSGLFIAKGNDKFGESGLVGEVSDEWSETGPTVEHMGYTIHFHKIYHGKPLDHTGLFRDDVGLYEGDVRKTNDGTIYFSGKYKLRKDHNICGIWELQSA